MQINEKQAKAEGYQLKQVKNHENHCGGIKTNENQHISPQVNRLKQAKTIENILKRNKLIKIFRSQVHNVRKRVCTVGSLHATLQIESGVGGRATSIRIAARC